METLIRYSAPGKYDHAPQETLCKVITTLSPEYTLYKQIGIDPEKPQWDYIGTFKE